jgi:hypothetical protein
MTTGRINQVARLKREPARQLQHRPGRAGPSRDANRKSLLIRSERHSTCTRPRSGHYCSLPCCQRLHERTRSACRGSGTTRRRIRAMIRTRDLPKSAGQSPAELALGTASVRAGRNPSDRNTAFNHAPTQGYRQHFGCPNDTKMSQGQAYIHQGTSSLPTSG